MEKQYQEIHSDLENTKERYEQAIIDLISNPGIETARLAHQASLRGYYALEYIAENHGSLSELNVRHYKGLNSICAQALEEVQVGNMDREHPKYWASLTTRRNEYVNTLTLRYCSEQNDWKTACKRKEPKKLDPPIVIDPRLYNLALERGYIHKVEPKRKNLKSRIISILNGIFKKSA